MGGETIANLVMWAATPPLEKKVMTRTRQSRAKRAKDNENCALQAAQRRLSASKFENKPIRQPHALQQSIIVE